MDPLLYNLLICTIGLLPLSQTGNMFPKYDTSRVDCTELDRNFVRIVECEVNVVRKTKLLSIRGRLLHGPVNDVVVRVAFFRAKKSFYEKNLPDAKVDFCKFIKGERRNFLFQWLLKPLDGYSNFLHSCPHMADIYIKDFPVNSLKPLPVFISGNYKMQVNITSLDIPRVMLEFYFTFP